MSLHKLTRWIKPVFFALLLLLSFYLIIYYPNDPAHTLFLKYLSILISWPGAVALISLIFIILFRPQIARKILTMKRLNPLTGKFEWGEDQSEADKEVREKHTEDTIKKMTALKDLKPEDMLRQFVNFEQLVRELYKSQFRLLEHLRILSVEKLKGKKQYIKERFYLNEYLKAGGNPKYSFEKYLLFLFSWQLTKEFREDGDDIIVLTETGTIFLTYCYGQGYTESTFLWP